MVLGIPKVKLDKLPPLKSWEKVEQMLRTITSSPGQHFCEKKMALFLYANVAPCHGPRPGEQNTSRMSAALAPLDTYLQSSTETSTTVHGRPWAWLTCILKLLFPIRIPNTMRLGWLSFLLYTDPPYVGDIVFTGSFFQASDSHLLQL